MTDNHDQSGKNRGGKYRVGEDRVGEFDMIRQISDRFQRSVRQVNNLFECDAEIVEMNGSLLAFTMDEFSEEEEFIGSGDPYLLGWNMAVGVISDLLAAGATPQFYSHACIMSPRFTGEYHDRFLDGISEAVSAAGAFFIGGDLGTSEVWRYVGAIFGTVDRNRLRMRTGIKPGDYLCITGSVGDGNRTALLNYLRSSGAGGGSGAAGSGVPEFPDEDSAFPAEFCTTRFELRLQESGFIGKHSNVSMDTSDGVVRTLETLSELNRCALVVDPVRIPYDPVSLKVLQAVGMPRECLLFGSAGEYELLFTVSPGNREEFLEQQSGCDCTIIGRAVAGEDVHFLNKDQDLISIDPGEPVSRYVSEGVLTALGEHRVDPRELRDIGRYIQALVTAVKAIFYG